MGTNSNAFQKQTKNRKTWGFISVWIQNLKYVWRLISGGNAGMEEFKKSGMINIAYWDHELIKKKGYLELKNLDISKEPTCEKIADHIRSEYFLPIFSVFTENSLINDNPLIIKIGAFELVKRVYDNLDKDPVLMKDPSLAFFIVNDMNLEIMRDIFTDRTAAFILNTSVDDLMIHSPNVDNLTAFIKGREIDLFNIVELIYLKGLKHDSPEDVFHLSKMELIVYTLKLIAIIYANVKLALIDDSMETLISNRWAIDCVKAVELLVMKPAEAIIEEKESEDMLKQLNISGIELPKDKEFYKAKFTKPIGEIASDLSALKEKMLKAIPEYQQILEFYNKTSEEQTLKDDDFE